MKKSGKTSMFVLSFLLTTGIFAQTSVYAKGNPGGSHGNSKVHGQMKLSTDNGEKAMPYGLAKKAIPPVIKQGGYLIPVNAVIKSLGADVVWDAANQSVTISKEGTTIIINLATKTATVNGVEAPLPAELVAATDTASGTVTDGTSTAVSTDVTVETPAVESISKHGTTVLFNFIAEKLNVVLDAAAEDEIVDEALAEDAAQTADTGTDAGESTYTVDTSTGL